MPKKLKGGLFNLARYYMLTFWFSSLDDVVQFDTIIFRRTFEKLFWSIRVD